MKKINWDEQPTPEHCWAEDLNADKDPDFEGWCKKCHDGSWRMDNAFSVWAHDAESKGNVKIHRKPEAIGELGLTGKAFGIGKEPYQPEVGDIIETLMSDRWVKAKVFGVGESGGCLAKPYGHWYDEFSSDRIRPVKSERDQFIEKFHDMDAGQMYDNGARFTDDNS